MLFRSDFEKAQKALAKAANKKNQEMSSAALEDLSSALLAYRTAGRLLGPDGGGDIPSVDEIRRAACRVQGRTFEKKVGVVFIPHRCCDYVSKGNQLYDIISIRSELHRQ